MRRRLTLAGVATLVLVAVAGCGHDNLRDLKGVPNIKPDYIVNVENMDKHPNIGLVCVHGAGFATTTRDYTAIQRVPEWDAFCLTKEQPLP